MLEIQLNRQLVQIHPAGSSITRHAIASDDIAPMPYREARLLVIILLICVAPIPRARGAINLPTSPTAGSRLPNESVYRA